ncbi:hypothetical protein DSM3645_15230 [Blastopirellula marina DSM 3645]|uniref:Uncharacterized protein n=1 Tax=Blastopirellula marina DSM 3645 TaxID=314230 RepID=A4A265_9BACT|nr:hypothetical protein DSM3645_15230 [Blastopirellula marina DSM 3645]
MLSDTLDAKSLASLELPDDPLEKLPADSLSDDWL